MDEEIKREFDRLWSVVTRMDDQGTRGVIALQIQITELIKDFGEFKLEMNDRMTTAKQTRRWFLAQVVALVGVMGGLIGLIIQARGK